MSLSNSLLESLQLFTSLQKDELFHRAFTTCAQVLCETLKNGGRILTCGNGGSLCDAMHFAEELTGRYHQNRVPLSALAISDPSHMSCVANDFGYQEVFARAVIAWGRPGDVLVSFSTSGNSKNIIRAMETAREHGIKNIALLGRDGGAALSLSDNALVIPSEKTSLIQETHIKLVHNFIEFIEKDLDLN